MRIRTLAAAILIAMAMLAVLGCDQPERPGLAWGTPAAEAEDGRPAAADTAYGYAARRLWAGDGLGIYHMSVADGRWVTWKDWTTFDLAVHDLHSGEIHRVTSIPRGEGYKEAHMGVFSRDARRIAYSWSEGPGASVRVVDFDGSGATPTASEPRVIYDNPLQFLFYLWDWSPDGRWVLGKMYGTDNTIAIAIFSSAGEAARTLKTFDWREPLRGAFSPDGRFVAYDLPSEADRRVRDIFVVSVDGSRERLIVGGGALNRLFGWDAEGILYVTQRGGAPELRRQPMADGQAAGAPELLRGDLWRADPIGFAGPSVYYGVVAEMPMLHIVDLDVDAGRLATTPKHVADELGGNARSMAWSPDGKHLAVAYRDPGQRGSRLAIRSENGDLVSELSLDLEPWAGRLQWFPDGRSLILFGRDEKGRLGFYRVSLETGTREVLLRLDDAGPSMTAVRFALSRDGETLYFARPENGAAITMVARTLASGEERRIGPIGWPGPIALSPDGSEIASVTWTEGREAIVIAVPVTGGAPRELFRLPAGSFVGSLNWTPDGERVLLVETRWETPSENHLRIVSANGDGAWQVEGIQPDWRNPTLHPNGRRFAYRTSGNREEIWILERNDSQATAAAARTSP